MRKQVLWQLPVSLCLILGVANAEKVKPTMTYKLHAKKVEHSANLPATLETLLPDQALVVLIPQAEGKWLLKRLTAWDTTTPKEESLAFNATPARDGLSGWDDISINPTRTYLVIRLEHFTGNIFPRPALASQIS